MGTSTIRGPTNRGIARARSAPTGCRNVCLTADATLCGASRVVARTCRKSRPMPPDPDAIDTLAHAVKDAVIDGYAALSEPLPAHRVVAPGTPALDCEGLYVFVERTFAHDGNVVQEVLQPMPAAAGFSLRACTIGVLLVRCVPVVSQQGQRAVPPKAEDEEAAAQQILRDATLVVTILGAAQKAGQLAGCNSLALENWTSRGPDGGLAGGLHRLRAGVG